MPKTKSQRSSGYVILQTRVEPYADVLMALIKRHFAKAAWRPEMTYERNQVVVWNGNETQTRFLDGFTAGVVKFMEWVCA